MSPRLTGYPLDPSLHRAPPKQAVRLKALAQVGLFKGVSKRSLIRIDQLSEVRYVSEGAVVVAEGDTGDDAMVVLAGRAAVTMRGRKLSEVSVGEVFGEMTLLDQQARSATVTALEPMQIVVIHGPQFRKLLSKVPGLTDSLLATLSTRLRDAQASTDI